MNLLLSRLRIKIVNKKKNEGSRKNTPDDMHPNAVDFSLFDDNEEILIDGDYQVLEGYAQRTERTHVHLIQT